MLLIKKFIVKVEIIKNYFANIRESYQKNNKKTEKFAFLLKNS